MSHSLLQSLIFTLLFMTLSPMPTFAEDKKSVLERPDNHVNTLFHVGLWVEDIDKMLEFLSEIMSYDIVLRSPRHTGGERLILSDARGQKIELLSDPDNVIPHPEFPLHPQGRVAGIAHISIWVEDALNLKKKLSAQGYEILGQVPADYSDGYFSSDGKMYRILFVRGPNEITFELFEIKK
jgi:catechol 2,3-dioxygenase-like lactoylglutathione lyase family enzyme